MGTKTPTGVCVHSQRCVSTHALPAMHTCGPHICTRRPWPGAQAHRVTRHHTGAPGAGRWAARMPSSRPHSPTPSSWPFFCNSCIYFTVLYIGRGFQNTLGLFTEPCRNTLSPFQLSLPERSISFHVAASVDLSFSSFLLCVLAQKSWSQIALLP